MKKNLFLSLLLFNEFLFSQNYSYREYLNDKELLDKFDDYLENNKIDSFKISFNSYKYRLGYTYYKYKTILASFNSDPDQLKHLDSAFMRGMTPVCIDIYLNKFDSAKVYKSFKQNYLNSYNLELISLLDSIKYKDQQYRLLMDVEYKKNPKLLANKLKNSSDTSKKNITNRDQARVDSLWQLQNLADSINHIQLKKIISNYGWPGAKLIGDFYCMRRAPDVSLLFIHLGNTKRDYQISTLKKVIELCKKQEDTWQTPELMIFGIHTKFSDDFSEFSFLEIKNNHLNEEKSFFSIYNMSKMLKTSNPKIEIKCSKTFLFNELKNLFYRQWNSLQLIL